jgi:phage gp46-like protein
MINDFAFNPTTGLFDIDNGDSLLTEIVGILNLKSASLHKDENGKSTYPGDWFLHPNIGSNTYEINTITADVELRLKNVFELALSSIVKSKKARTVSVSVNKNYNDKNRYNVIIEVIRNDNSILAYEYFTEVA